MVTTWYPWPRMNWAPASGLPWAGEGGCCNQLEKPERLPLPLPPPSSHFLSIHYTPGAVLWTPCGHSPALLGRGSNGEMDNLRTNNKVTSKPYERVNYQEDQGRLLEGGDVCAETGIKGGKKPCDTGGACPRQRGQRVQWEGVLGQGGGKGEQGS